MNDEELLAAQRQLRLHLLDRSALRWRPARDLAAHLLLHLDEPESCWRFAAGWLREAFDADRVDCGFGHPDDAHYHPQVEALRRDRAVPSVIGLAVEATDHALQAAWHAHGVVVLRDVAQERLLGQRMRAALMRMGTRVKMAAPIMGGDQPIGMVCVDWMDVCDPARDERWAQFEEVAAGVLGPVMSASQRVACGIVHDGVHDLLECLTPAERIVARLAADGLSYKEIARRLGRSLSTIDHQLRSARTKLGVRSTARLVHLVSTGKGACSRDGLP